MKQARLLYFLLGIGLAEVDLAPVTARAAEAVRSVTLAVSPLVLKSPAGERYTLAATIQAEALTDAKLELTAAAWPQAQAKTLGNLPAGTNRVELETPPWTGPAEVRVAITSAAGRQEFGPLKAAAPRQWMVYLSQHTHTDIGYTRPQTEILPEHLRYLDYVLDYCDLTDAYPEDARFRWTCETSWAVREYLNRRPARQLERLRQRVQQGRIEIAGMLVNMSEIATESSLAASLQPLRLLKQHFGAHVETAMQNDVNGAAWCLVDYFADCGIKYLTMGINQTRSILPFDKPTAFWWESPAGKRVLAYRSDHYMTANFWHLHEGKLDKVRPEVAKYLGSLEARNYAFDRVGVQFSGYFTDNSPPSTAACDVVKAWNEQYTWPRLRLATAREFLAHVEQEHRGELQVFKAAWPDWWTDGFGSAARETGAARDTETALQVTQGLLAMAALLGLPLPADTSRRLAQIQDGLIFYAEHTYGAAESIDDPLAENSQVQWAEKAAYVWEAVKQSNLLREEAFGLMQEFLPRADVPTIAVVNSLSWTRSGLAKVFIDHEVLPSDRAYRLVDAQTGKPVLAQPMNRRAEGTYWALWVPDVPALGFKTLRIELGPGPRPAEPPAPSDTGLLENQHYRLTLDPDKGALQSLMDKETGQELVDQQAAWALGQCLYETLSPGREMKREAFKRVSVRNVKIKPGSGGPIWKSLLVSADLDGCATNNALKVEVRLYEPEKRVELHFAARKLPVRSAEALYVAFPFRSPDGTVLYEAQGGAMVPGVDQIPGSSSDWQTVQNFIAIRNRDGQIVQVCDQAPLVQLGDFNLGKWQKITQVAKPHVYSWVMNNYWFTNFRVEQEGEFKWNYSLSSSKDTSRTFACRFGWDARVPFATRVFPPGKSPARALPAAASVVGLKPSNLLLVEAKPAWDGNGVVVHLRELEGQAVTITEDDVSVSFPLRQADEVNVLEETLREGVESLTFRPFESKFIRLSL